MFVSFQNSYVGTLTLNVMVLGNGTFGIKGWEEAETEGWNEYLLQAQLQWPPRAAKRAVRHTLFCTWIECTWSSSPILEPDLKRMLTN